MSSPRWGTELAETLGRLRGRPALAPPSQSRALRGAAWTSPGWVSGIDPQGGPPLRTLVSTLTLRHFFSDQSLCLDHTLPPDLGVGVGVQAEVRASGNSDLTQPPAPPQWLPCPQPPSCPPSHRSELVSTADTITNALSVYHSASPPHCKLLENGDIA